MAESKPINIVNDDANWSIRIRTEAKCAKHFQENWGCLCSKTPPVHQPHMKARAQYVAPNGHVTVTNIRVPLHGQAAEQAKLYETAALSSLSTTGSSTKSGMTALDSTLLSHIRQMDSIRASTPGFSTSSRAYGSRPFPLEQFGLSQHGIKKTDVTTRTL